MSERTEAIDALLGTIGEFSKIWEGAPLLPEIVDAELHDCYCPSKGIKPKIPNPLLIEASYCLQATWDYMEAFDTILATLAKYGCLWKGDDLDPEIVDAEFYDCPNLCAGVDLPAVMYIEHSPTIVQQRDRRDALCAVLAGVAVIGERQPKGLYTLFYDGMFYDTSI